ncbi:MAG TPA: ExeM/NucH family extracellular endonuclease [Polyangiales bacterium]|nr:ExeM/NucH family extracellular endonuclease [Polyangiales bacterium]
MERSGRRVALAATLLLLLVSRAHAVSPDIVVSQVYGGGGNSGATLRNDFIELFNRGSTAVSLTGWSVQYGPSSAGSWQVTALAGVIQPGQYLLVQEAQGAGGTMNLPSPDVTGTIALSATGGIVALSNTTTAFGAGCPNGAPSLVDLVGYGASSCAEGSTTPALSAMTAAQRIGSGCTDTDANSVDFSVAAPAPRNSSTAAVTCGEAAPSVVSSSPAPGEMNVSPAATITVTFSEPVAVASSAIRIECPAGTLVASNSSAFSNVTTASLTPSQDMPAGVCLLSVSASGVSDVDTSDPPDHPSADYTATFAVTSTPCSAADTPIGQIQGTGTSAALSGTRTVQGVVVGDYEFLGTGTNTDHLRGFFLQNTAATSDANPDTSDAIFVFSGNGNFVNVGQLVQVTGNVTEFDFGSTGGTLTEMTSPQIEICAASASVPPTDITLPLSGATELERYEGMLVRLPQTLYVSEHFQLGRFGQVLLSAGSRLVQPTHGADPGPAAAALQAANNLNRILLDDDLQAQNPDPIKFGRGGSQLTAANTLRGGDTVAGIVGVLTQSDATVASNVPATTDPVLYRVRPFNVLGGGSASFLAANPRPTLPVASGGRLRIAGFNLLNYFNTFGSTACSNGVGGAATECRGAENQAEFDRQWPKTVQAAVGTSADILVLNELENDGYGPSSALQHLVDKLNAATAPGTYDFVRVDANTGQTNALGNDAIRIGMVYKPARATPVGRTAVANTAAFGVYQTGAGAFQRNRPALAQAFADSCGGRVVVVGNHLKSKGSSCADNISPVGPDPDVGDGQGECNLTRKAATEQLVAWLSTDPTQTGESRILILGDMNSYSREDPIRGLEAGGYTNLIDDQIGAAAYSYVFDGQWGYLDYAFGSEAVLNQIADVVEAHINADEPAVLDYNTNFKSTAQLSSLYASDAYRASDHDPVVVSLDLTCPAQPAPATHGWSLGWLVLVLSLSAAAALRSSVRPGG